MTAGTETATAGSQAGPCRKVGPSDSTVEKVKETGKEAKQSFDATMKFWATAIQMGMLANTTRDYSFLTDHVFSRKAGILGNFKGIGAVITSIAISLGVGAIVLDEFKNQTQENNQSDKAVSILNSGLDLLGDTIDWMGVAVIMLFGVIFMRYME